MFCPNLLDVAVTGTHVERHDLGSITGRDFRDLYCMWTYNTEIEFDGDLVGLATGFTTAYSPGNCVEDVSQVTSASFASELRFAGSLMENGTAKDFTSPLEYIGKVDELGDISGGKFIFTEGALGSLLVDGVYGGNGTYEGEIAIDDVFVV
uniref:Uncharacterized protein n=1 Tax=Lotharella globosa TaxID=91324 RepID=A0A7S3ZBZ1_9EUKA